MAFYAAPMENLLEKLCSLPGIGPKSAARLAFYILSVPRDEAEELARAIVELKEKIGFCRICFNICEGEACEICADQRRDESVLCVVEEPGDVIAVERTGRYRGRYHVLGGAISPIDGVGPDELRFQELISRLREGAVTEVIVATNPNAEGEATALYLAAGEPARSEGDTDSKRAARGWRPRVRRRGHTRPRDGRPPPTLNGVRSIFLNL